MPLPEELKKDWDDRDLTGIDPDINITTKILVKDNSPSDILISALLVNVEFSLIPFLNNNVLNIGYGTLYENILE